ncbi:MAG: S-layer protein domain-containing protein [Candidatus Methanoperedens sp.]|nr:S-layer protein domain-containing protein [Candidatus Methanoperedens sp.]
MSKRITSVALAVLMLLSVALPASAQIQATSVEVRGTVYNETAIAPGFGGSGPVSWNPQSFAGFYYDLKDNLGKENLNIQSIDITNRKIGKNNLTYSTTAEAKTLKVVSEQYNNSASEAAAAGLQRTGSGQAFQDGKYYIIGWQAERYVAVNSKVDKLSKLLLEHGTAAADKKTLTVGETWDLGGGWTLTANSIDARATPRQVWLTLSKDGVKKDDAVISSGTTTAKPIYTYVEKSLAGETDVPMFVTYVDSVFAGATTDMVQFRYTWVISSDVTQIRSADTYGVFKDASVNTVTRTLSLKNTDTEISLTRDSTVDLMGNLKFKVADSNDLRFYPMVIRDQPGTYEVRGTVYNETAIVTGFGGSNDISWTPQSFAGFYYDLKDNLGKENLSIANLDITNRKIGKNDIIYSTTAEAKTLKVVSEQYNNSASEAAAAGLQRTGSGQAFQDGKYYIIGWQAERYVAVNSKVDKLSKLLLEHGTAAADKKTLTVGETWDLGGGWTLTANSIDARATPRQVWLTLSKDGVKKDDAVISSGTTTAKPIYTYVEKSLAGETDVPMFVTYVDSVFAGATTDMVQFRFTWVISSDVTQIRSADTYGVFKDASVNTVTRTLSLKNTDTEISLTRDSTQDLMGNLKFRTADSNELRFYPKVDYQIGEVEPGLTPTPIGTPTPTPPVNVTVTPTATPPVETPVETPPPATPTPTPTPETPGFTAVFAIAGMIAVAYLVLRQRK